MDIDPMDTAGASQPGGSASAGTGVGLGDDFPITSLVDPFGTGVGLGDDFPILGDDDDLVDPFGRDVGGDWGPEEPATSSQQVDSLATSQGNACTAAPKAGPLRLSSSCWKVELWVSGVPGGFRPELWRSRRCGPWLHYTTIWASTWAEIPERVEEVRTNGLYKRILFCAEQWKQIDGAWRPADHI